MVEYFCAALAGVLAVVVAALSLKLWHYRAAIIQLQADMTLVLNDLTRPTTPRMIECDICERKFIVDDFAHHPCRQLKDRAKDRTEAYRLGQRTYYDADTRVR